MSLIADPQLRSLNNEPAIVRTTTESRSGDRKDGERSSLPAETLSVTSQIGPDGIVMMSLSPIVAVRSCTRALSSPPAGSNSPVAAPYTSPFSSRTSAETPT